MPGALVHIGIGLIAAFIVYAFHFKLEYSISIFIGNLFPDAISVIIGAIKTRTLSLTKIWHSQEFMHSQYSITGSLWTWFSLGFFVFAIGALLYHYQIIGKRKMEEYDKIYIFFLIGIMMHLILDLFFVETTAWI